MTGALPTGEGRVRQGHRRLHGGHPAQPEVRRAYCNRGCATGGKAENAKAIRDYTEAIRLDPKDAEAYYSRGFCYHQRREYDKAIADLTEAIRFNPKHAAAYMFRARPIRKRASSTRPSPTSPRPSGSSRTMPWRIATGAPLTRTKASATRRWPTTTRPSGSTPVTPGPTVTAAAPTPTRGNFPRRVADLNEALRLDPEFAEALSNRAFLHGNMRPIRPGRRRLRRSHPP